MPLAGTGSFKHREEVGIKKVYNVDAVQVILLATLTPANFLLFDFSKVRIN